MKLFKTCALLFMVCSSFMLAGCNNEKEETKTTIKLDPVQLEIFEDDSSLLKVETNSLKPVAFLSYDSDIACVSSSGRVIGKNVGSTTIKASIDDVYATCDVVVKPLSEKQNDYIKFEASSLIIDLNENKVNRINPTYYSKGQPVLDAKFSYSSSDNKVASIDEDGKINPFKPGAITVTVKSGDLTSYVLVDIYTIIMRTPDDWMTMLQTTNDIHARYYLANDLDFTEVKYVTYANSLENKICGELNGNYHTVRNITMSPSNDRQSIFGYVTVFTLSNIRFENIVFNSSYKNSGLFVSILQHNDEIDSAGNSVAVTYQSSISNVLCDFIYSNVTSCIIAENFYGASVDNVFANISNSNGKDFKPGMCYATSEHFYNWFGNSHIINFVVRVSGGSISVDPKKADNNDYLVLDQVKIDATNSLVEANYLASKSFDTNIWDFKPTQIPTFL